MLRHNAGPAVAGSYTAGALTGALVTSFALFVLSGLLSPIPASLRSIAAISTIAVLLLHTLRVVCLDFLPQRKYQIPRETFNVSPSRAAFRFAFELGTGVRTYITAVSPYALAVAMLLTLPSSLGTAALSAFAAAAGFGIGRSMIVAIQSLRSTVAVEHPSTWLRTADIVTVTLALVVAIAFAIGQG